ncbi:hypothetical protein [Deinococcus misasensis]|uniref:hypothetical protein n=1 Tax=Deinococcus misasensis TaxID=392413 RepID=UPI000AD4F181|nr:hypothetical protein [Deinococcus misasensis]
MKNLTQTQSPEQATFEATLEFGLLIGMTEQEARNWATQRVEAKHGQNVEVEA